MAEKKKTYLKPTNGGQMNMGNQSDGMPRSLIIHGLLLLIAFFYSFKTDLKDKDPDKPYNVVMEMDFRKEVVKRPPPEPPIEKLEEFKETSNSTKANADKGESRPINPEVQKVKVNDPKPPVPTPTPPAPAVKTVPNVRPTPPSKPPISSPEDSPVKAKESPIDIDKPTRDDAPTRSNPGPSSTTTTKPSAPPSKAPVPGAGTVGSPTGTGSKPQSNTDGNGQGKSDSGPGRGSDSGTDVTSGLGNSSDGTGEFDGSGTGIFNRKVVFKNFKAIPMMMSGKVTIKVCINRAGDVTFTELIPNETTIKDKPTLKKCLIAAKGYKYTADNKSPAEVCGKTSMNLDINRFK